MEQYLINIPNKQEPNTLLPFGGSAPDGTTLEVNSRYFLKNGKPWYPVMGEFHYSRYPENEWEENLQKMRAGGIQIVASYVIWIHHEEIKGEWDFSGSRNLRRFLELCRKTGLMVWLRIGPWAHGEVRNGGFPDWLQHDKTLKLRSDDPAYLAQVRTFYGKIMEQASGMLFKNGGPVIGIQLENEYGHCGGESGAKGLAHMSTLKKMALEIGFDVPFYTATGWGGAHVVDGEMLPVQGGYADAPWEQHTHQLPANENYLLAPFRNDPLIGSDWGHKEDSYTFKVDDYPYLTAELGGGIQVTKLRRPMVSGGDTAALALCKLATGANLLGYYMYHGGTNPQGKLSTLEETKASGSYTDVPALSYDFQAVINEYGELHASYRKLKNLHLFLSEFGEWTAPAVCVFPENMVTNADDTEALRYAVRYNEKLGGGFLFINNHQRHRNMVPHKDVQISVKLPDETIAFPPINIENHDFGIYPFNLPLGNALLKSSNAQLLCRLGESYVFVCGDTPVFNFEGEPFPFLVLTSQEAENAWKLQNALYVTAGELFEDNRGIRIVTTRTEESVLCYPQKTVKKFSFEPLSCDVCFNLIKDSTDCMEVEIRIDMPEIVPESIYDVILELDYHGDRSELYIDGHLAADWFTFGTPWRVGLKRFGFPKKLVLKLYPASGEVYYEFDAQKKLALISASLQPKYTALF